MGGGGVIGGGSSGTDSRARGANEVVAIAGKEGDEVTGGADCFSTTGAAADYAGEDVCMAMGGTVPAGSHRGARNDSCSM